MAVVAAIVGIGVVTIGQEDEKESLAGEAKAVGAQIREVHRFCQTQPETCAGAAATAADVARREAARRLSDLAPSAPSKHDAARFPANPPPPPRRPAQDR